MTLKWSQCTSRMSNTITTVANASNSILTGQYQGLKTTLSAANITGQTLSVTNGGTLANGIPGSVSPFTFVTPPNSFKAGTVTIKGGNEEAEIDAAFINDLKLLLEVINDLPDEHPMGDLKHDMRMRRAFKKLGG